MTWWSLLLLVLVASFPSVLLTILLWKLLRSSTSSQQASTVLLERAINLLSARDPSEFLRLQTSPSTSLLYPPSEPGEPVEDTGPLSAYQRAIQEGAPDDVAQFVED